MNEEKQKQSISPNPLGQETRHLAEEIESFFDLKEIPKILFLTNSSFDIDSLGFVKGKVDKRTGLTFFFSTESGLGFLHLKKPHYFEDFSKTAMIIRAVSFLGVKNMFTIALAHSISENLQMQAENGESVANKIAVITDHINMTGKSPLTNINPKVFKNEYYRPNNVYDADLIEQLEQSLEKNSLRIKLNKAVYRLVPDFSFGTEAEINQWKRGDNELQVFGCSIVPEAITANHIGMKVLALVQYNKNKPQKSVNEKFNEVIKLALEEQQLEEQQVPIPISEN